jgi:hypothetical protein
MSTGLLYDCDDIVARWLFSNLSYPIYKYDRCVGLVDPNGTLVGAVLFQHWNGANVELSYYGKNTLTVGIIRSLARYTLTMFDPARLSMTTGKRNRQLIKALQKIGFKFEGTARCYYGKRDINRNVGVRMVMFRDGLEAVAKVPQEATRC